jgi:stage III sporulation protein AH
MSYNSGEGSAESNQQLEYIIQTALREAQIESLIIAKGYAECVVYITEEGISIAVATPEGGLKQEDVAVIADIVLSQSDFGIEDITVVEVY